jgi:small nuclear ribonucleoprotein (snRNP)-like protein
MHYEELRNLVAGYESEIEQLRIIRLNYEQIIVKLKNNDEQLRGKITSLEEEIRY